MPPASRTGFWRIVGDIYARAWAIGRRYRVGIVGGAIVLLALAWWVSRFDARVTAWVTAHREETLKHIARNITRAAELHLAPLAACAILGLVGWRMRNLRLRMAGLAGLLGTLTAGLSALLLKMMIGRPRPYAQLPDGWYGWSWHARMQSFPSGHTSHCFGLALAVTCVAPRSGIVLCLLAAVVAATRVYLGDHYPSDLVGGFTLGAVMGLPLGVATRQWLAARTSSDSKAR